MLIGGGSQDFRCEDLGSAGYGPTANGRDSVTVDSIG